MKEIAEVRCVFVFVYLRVCICAFVNMGGQQAVGKQRGGNSRDKAAVGGGQALVTDDASMRNGDFLVTPMDGNVDDMLIGITTWLI